MTEINWTPEEKAYLDAERGIAPDAAPKEEAPAEEAQAEPEATEPEQQEEEQPEAKAEESEEEEADEDAPQEPVKKRTPIDTIRELRAERRELRQQVKEFNKFKETANARLQELMEFRTKAEAPDPDIDPDGHARYQEKVQAEKAQEQQKAQEETKLTEERRTLYETVVQQESAFHAATPDYYDTIQAGKNAAIEARQKYWMDMDVPEEEAYDTASNEIEQYLEKQAREILGRKGNFAKFAYQQAKQFVSQNGNGAQPKEEPAKAEPAKVDTAPLKQLADGKAAARKTKGSGGNKELTVEDLVSMTDEEFHKHAGDTKKLRKIFGE